MNGETTYYAHVRERSTGPVYWHVYPSRVAAELAGKGPIVDVTVTEDPDGAYWAWSAEGRPHLSHIYPNRTLLGMCFPYGLDAAEEAGDGRAVRVRIEPVKEAS